MGNKVKMVLRLEHQLETMLSDCTVGAFTPQNKRSIIPLSAMMCARPLGEERKKRKSEVTENSIAILVGIVMIHVFSHEKSMPSERPRSLPQASSAPQGSHTHKQGRPPH